MSYFDNANKQVTRKSFGSKVDKEFKREGVIPVKDRKKNTGADLVAEAAKQQELDKKVRDTRLNELKNRKAYDTAIQEGYINLKDDLMKDILETICIESLLIDENVVNENYVNIIDMIDMQLESIGGFLGVKHIADTYKNPLLKSMVNLCESTSKKVGERNIRESKGQADKVDFSLNKIELDEYNYKKRDIGIDTIVDNIKDKVFQVVQDEQKLNNDRQMIMSDIQNKVSEIQVPAEEAMKFIFESVGVEEETLFGSLMRSHYKQILESNSSPIFESFDYKDEEGPRFEDSEFEISDLSIVDMDDEDKKEIEDAFINECQKLVDIDDEEFETTLENIYNILVEGSENIIAKGQAEHYKSIVRKVQEELEVIEEKYVHNIQKHARKISNKKLDKSIVKWEQDIERTRQKIKNEKDPVCLDDYREDLRIMIAELKALKAEKDHRGKQLKIAKEANPYMKSTMENVTDVKQRLLNAVEETDSADKAVDDSTIEKDMKDMAKAGKDVTEEIILCPTCGKEDCTCKTAKESLISIYIDKLDNLCEDMNKIIEAHEEAYNTVIESLTKVINDEDVVVPYLQPNDLNLNNLEFAYKTKIVCETLKNGLKYVEYQQEGNTIEKAVELNIKSINEAIELVNGKDKYEHKIKLMKKGKIYLNKILEAIDRVNLNIDTCEGFDPVFNSPEDVENIFEHVKEYNDIETTNNDVMEVVLAESIVEYTILEMMNTLNLVRYTKDSVRQMSRKNISK